MKIQNLIIIGLILLVFNLSQSQEKGLFYKDKKIDISNITNIKAQAGASLYIIGVGEIKTRAIIANNTSNVIVEADSLYFHAYFGDVVIDDFSNNNTGNITSPSDFLLFPLEQHKNTRRLLVGTTGTFSGSEIGLNSEGSIAFESMKLENGYYEIRVNPRIPDGEYAFVPSYWLGAATKLWAFTVINSKYNKPEK